MVVVEKQATNSKACILRQGPLKMWIEHLLSFYEIITQGGPQGYLLIGSYGVDIKLLTLFIVLKIFVI